MIGDNVKVSNDGTVTGTINYVSKMPQYEGENAKGHFFPLKFNELLYGISLHVGGSVSDMQFNGGKDIQPSLEDPYLVIRIENCTDRNMISVFDSDSKDELFKLDFNHVALRPPVGANAVKVDSNTNFGNCGLATQWMNDVQIKWNDINGEVIGNFNKSEGKTTKGTYQFALAFDEYFRGKHVKLNLATDDYWNECGGHVKLNGKSDTLIITCENTTLAKLTFNTATFK